MAYEHYHGIRSGTIVLFLVLYSFNLFALSNINIRLKLNILSKVKKFVSK